VLDVVLMGCYNPKNIWQRTTKADLHIAHQSLEKVNLQDYAKRQIAQLSGGQQQRVFIARALAQQADLYIMDEPFAGVDAATEAAILEILMDLKQQGKTVVMVHHDLQTAQEFFDWIILLSNRLVASAPTAAVLTPELLQEAYGGKLTILSRMAEVLKQK
jgi:manganese/zinc/iron transport system ATP- binding protein